jgi:thiol-disulfide isomerase/thioredoxin
VIAQTETDENAKTASQTEADVQAKAGAQTEAEDQAGAGLETGALIQTEDGKEAAAQADEAGDSGEDGSDAQSRSYESNAPIGHEVGQQLADFTAECFDGSTFHLADMRGKIVFINLWATYCTPCVHELPYFSDLYQAHGDDIAMLAVHSPLAPKDDPKEFIAGRGYAMPFTKDVKEGTIFQIVGGGATLPQTIVLNRRGEVVYNQVKSVTPEALEALYRLADQQS